MQELSVKQAEYITDYKLSLTFNDGKKQVVDFAPFVKKSHHQDIKKYQNMKLFKQFNIRDGDLEWGDYELVFPVYDLYQNTIN